MAAKKDPPIQERLKKTNLNHVFLFDVNNDGAFREIAVVKIVRSGPKEDDDIVTMHYIDVASLDNIDKGRLKAIVTSPHADKYELWDLMSQPHSVLNNGKNALDYFHQLVRIARGPGSINTSMGGGLAGVKAESNTIIGTGFTDPRSGTIESST